MSFTSQSSTISNETFGKDASFKLPQLIGSMSISPSGRDVVLGSKEGLHIIDLDSPYSPPRFLPHRTSWEVADVQWSPFADRDYWVASTSNQKALVWNLNLYGWRNSIQFVLHSHTRAITDINFSAHHPDKLATCAVDSFVHCWDLRTPERPAISFSDWFAGATQVKWSRQDEHVIASSHDKFLHIWDNRKGAYPARTIQAHDTKIYGIDWNRFEPNKIVTCSLDRTIKFWDTSNDDDAPERVIETTFPVRRARHTPFGWGLMVMPQRGNGDLHLYDRRAVNGVLESGKVRPVHVFPGHKGQVKEFLWRFYGTVKDGIDHRDFQLVSWGTDRELRLHAVSRDTFEDVGYEKGVSKPQRLRFTRRGAKYRTFRDEVGEQDALTSGPARTDSFPTSNQFLRVRGRPSTNMGMSRLHLQLHQLRGGFRAGRGRGHDMHGKGSARPDTDPISWMKNVKIAAWDTDSLADEITQVGEKFKNVDFEMVDVSARRATLSLQGPWGDLPAAHVYVRVDFRFPKGYPKDAQAMVYVQKTNSIAPAVQQKLALESRQIADAHKSRGLGCIEAIIRYLLKDQTLEQILEWIQRDTLSDSKILEDANLSATESDDSDDDQLVTSNIAQANANFNVPHAKGCAAIWAENGKLVCFFPQKEKESSFLSALESAQIHGSDSNKLFGRFGNFQIESPARRAKDASQALMDDTSLYGSDDSSTFSSSSSSSSSSIDFQRRNRSAPWQRPTLDSVNREKSGDGSQKSTTLDGTKAGDSATKAIVKIFDFTDILPAQKRAAEEYDFKSTWSSTFEHNFSVAAKYSLDDAAFFWRLARTIFSSEADGMSHNVVGADMHLFSNSLRAHLSRIGVDPGDVLTKELTTSLEDGYVKDCFIPAMFQVFDHSSDVQMLGMVSAAYLHSVVQALAALANAGIIILPADSLTHTSYWQCHPSRTKCEGRNHPPSSAGPEISISGNLFAEWPEMSSSAPNSTAHTGYPTKSHASSGAPSVIAHDPSGAVSTIQSAAGSPESNRAHKRLEGFGFPTASAKLPTFARSRPASPPDLPSRNSALQSTRSSKSLRASPDDNFGPDSRSKLRTSPSMVNVSSRGMDGRRLLGNGIQARRTGATSTTSSSLKPSKKKLKTRLFNHTQYASDNAGPRTVFIDLATILQQCLTYLQQYLPLLEVWQLWPQRAELLKLHAKASEIFDLLSGSDNRKDGAQHGEQGLEVFRSCLTCQQPVLSLQGSDLLCFSETCKKVPEHAAPSLSCVVCEDLVFGAFMPCLNCNHATCYDCAVEWFGPLQVDRTRTISNSSTTSRVQTVESGDSQHRAPSCPTGCGCQCSLVTVVDVPPPLSTAVLAAQQVSGQPTSARTEVHEDNPTRGSVIDGSSHRGHRGQSTSGHASGGPESALDALLALQSQSRNRSTSHNVGTASNGGGIPQPSISNNSRTREDSVSAVDELLPWASDNHATLGRGLGPGFSRGLSNKSSDATIRKSTRK